MSIIQEALRRKAEEQAGASGVSPPTPSAVRPTPRRRDRKPGVAWRARGWFLLLALAALLSAGYGVVTSRWRRAAPRATAPSGPLNVGVPDALEASPAAAALAPAADHPSEVPGTPPPKAPAAVQPETAGSPAAGDAGASSVNAPAPSEVAVPSPPAVEASAPPEPPAVSWPALDVQGIVLCRPPQSSVALINGRRLRVGGIIEGARLVAIEEEQVLLDYRGHRRAFRVGEVWE